MADQENGIGVCSWKEWQTLTEDQIKFESHRNFAMLYNYVRTIDGRTENMEDSINHIKEKVDQPIDKEQFKPDIRRYAIFGGFIAVVALGLPLLIIKLIMMGV